MREAFQDGVFASLPEGSRFGEVVDFYLFRTPCPGSSRLGRTFGDLGWTGGKVNSLQAAMRGESSLGVRWVCDRAGSLPGHLARFNGEAGDAPREYAVYSKGSRDADGTKTRALFHGIRCALAHGGFRVYERGGEVWYDLENVHRGRLRGAFRLRESTLLAWARTVTEGPGALARPRARGGRRR